MSMTIINEELVARATATLPKLDGAKEHFVFFCKMLFTGSFPEVAILSVVAIIVLSLKNDYPANNTGQAIYDHGDGFFIILSVVAGILHAVDVLLGYVAGEYLLVDWRVSTSPWVNLLFALGYGAVFGAMLFSVSFFIRRTKTKQIEMAAYYRHVHRLGRK